MHLLDFFMYPVIMIIYWYLLDILSGGEFTDEIGGIIGVFFGIVITIIYFIIFCWVDYNWIDIFRNISNINFKF